MSMNILTPDDLAQMLGLKRKTIIDIYSKQPGFPAPLSQRKPRWLEAEVRRFMQRKSGQNANKASEAP
jgi:predicted DNA-binding transcriptional regulator AlpA